MKAQIHHAPAPGMKRPALPKFGRVAAVAVVAALATGCAAEPAAARAYVYVGAPFYVYPPPVVYAPRPVYVAPRPVYVSPAPAPIYAAPTPTCHPYQTSVTVGGVSRPMTGTACLQPDGSWRVVN